MQTHTHLSESRFSVTRRRVYVDSVKDDVDKFNFFRPSQQGWDGDAWFHSFQDDQGRTFRVAAGWKDARNGDYMIVSHTTPGTAFSSAAATFCNFNVSFCYHQAYGGPCLQYLNGAEHSANDMIDILTGEWQTVTAALAARIANAGGFVLAGKKKEPIGHVLFLLEGSDEGGNAARVNVFHVGEGLPRETTIAHVWADTATVRYLVPPDTYQEFLSAEG